MIDDSAVDNRITQIAKKQGSDAPAVPEDLSGDQRKSVVDDLKDKYPSLKDRLEDDDETVKAWEITRIQIEPIIKGVLNEIIEDGEVLAGISVEDDQGNKVGETVQKGDIEIK